MTPILAIDPGPEKSAFVLWDGSVICAEEISNSALMARVESGGLPDCLAAIEMVACFGMPVGREVFETCLFIGELKREFYHQGKTTRLVYRKDVKMHLCQSMRAKDGNIRAALIDKHGAPGTKANKGKTYGISGHLWAALAVADYVASVDELRANLEKL